MYGGGQYNPNDFDSLDDNNQNRQQQFYGQQQMHYNP